jgi:hypothetical protein
MTAELVVTVRGGGRGEEYRRPLDEEALDAEGIAAQIVRDWCAHVEPFALTREAVTR